MSERARASSYMQWAKENHGRIRFNLAVSGMPPLGLADLGVSAADLEIREQDGRGWEPLLRALGAKHGVPHDWVVEAEGASLANHLVLGAFLDPGDDALVEEPGYGPIVDTARFLGARVVRFPRRRESAFAVDPADVAQALTPRTRVVVLTNLHNPSAALIPETTLVAVGEIARARGACVLVDEVYLDAAFDDAPRSAVHLGEHFVVTSSLTKVYGLSGLRCGFVLAHPAVARRIHLLKDLFGVNAVHVAERLAVLALQQLPRLAARTRALLDANRPILNRFLEAEPRLQAAPIVRGTVSFPRLLHGSADRLCDVLRENYETSVTPGRFFGADDHVRIGISCETATLEAGLHRLGAALADLGGA